MVYAGYILLSDTLIWPILTYVGLVFGAGFWAPNGSHFVGVRPPAALKPPKSEHDNLGLPWQFFKTTHLKKHTLKLLKLTIEKHEKSRLHPSLCGVIQSFSRHAKFGIPWVSPGSICLFGIPIGNCHGPCIEIFPEGTVWKCVTCAPLDRLEMHFISKLWLDMILYFILYNIYIYINIYSSCMYL